MTPPWTRRPPVIAAAAAIALLAGMVTGVLAARAPSPAPSGNATGERQPAVSGDGWWQPLPAAKGAFVPAELVVEKLRVRAPIQVKGVDARNVMEAPDSADSAAWYAFSARPGAGGNAVFAGHRDFGPGRAPAIFWDLDKLAAGDLLDVVSPQRTEIRYRVTQARNYPLTSIPMDKVLVTDHVDEVTLITAYGDYVQGSGYDHRLVVRAVRIA